MKRILLGLALTFLSLIAWAAYVAMTPPQTMPAAPSYLPR